MHPHFVDYAIIAIYFVFVLGIGFALRGRMKTSEDFFLSGRSIPGWITGLAFMSANLGALEVMGHAANAAKYGMYVNHFYWLAAMPAMCFVGVFMMPFYYGSKVRSVPEFLRKRYDEKTRTLNALCFAFMTLLVSGVDLYAMAILFQRLLNWPFWASVVASAVVVAIYIYLGGLTSSIYNEVLQFFLIVFGFLPLAILGLKAVGGFAGLKASLPNPGYAHTWANIWHAADNPMGINWFGTIFGLGFVLSFGYWCTDFLVIQRGLAAKDMAAAQRTPLIAAVPKMFFPLLVVLPGLVAIALDPTTKLMMGGRYDNALPAMLGRFYPSGLLGIGLTALMASFMSGMAGNVTAFNTVWTFDIYQTHINPGKDDHHYLTMGRVATVFAVIVGIGTAFIVLQIQQPDGLSPAPLRVFQCAALRHVPAGNVLEAHQRPLGILGIAVRHPGCRRALHALSLSLHPLSQRHGGKLLPGHLGLCGLLLRHGGGNLLYGTAQGRGTGGLGLFPDPQAQDFTPSLV